MILKFKGPKSPTYGRCKYLGIDTVKKVFATDESVLSWGWSLDAIQVKTSDLKRLEKQLIKEGLKKVKEI